MVYSLAPACRLFICEPVRLDYRELYYAHERGDWLAGRNASWHVERVRAGGSDTIEITLLDKRVPACVSVKSCILHRGLSYLRAAIASLGIAMGKKEENHTGVRR